MQKKQLITHEFPFSAIPAIITVMRLLFSGLGILIYTSLCTYIGSRLFGFLRFFLPGVKALAFWLPFLLLCYASIMVNLTRSPRLIFMRHFSAYGLAVFMYLFLSFIVFDLLRLALMICKRSLLTPQFSAVGIGAALCLCCIMIVCGAVHARSISTARYKINIPGQNNDVRLALISDLHIGSTVNRAWISRVVDKINSAEPDMVCIAGDIFDGNLDIVNDLPGLTAEFNRINAPLGVYACLGNHDVDRMFQAGKTERIEKFLSEAGVTLLQDEATEAGENILIIGRRDARPIGMNSTRKPAAELRGIINSGHESGKIVIVLDHQPTQFAQIEEAGADLVLCGHTHSGQLFPANLITLGMYKKAGGTHYGYWKGKSLQALVTSGAGVWGPPLRIATNNEVAIIDIGGGQ